MKTLKEIALAILERRRHASNVVLPNEMQEKIGAEGYQEALRLGWLTPVIETGDLAVTMIQSKVDEMMAVAESPDEPLTPEPIKESVGRQFIPRAQDRVFESYNTTAPSISNVPQMRPQAGQEDMHREVGDSVVVTHEGKTFTGKVAAVGPDGKLKISFGAASRPSVERDYDANETKRLDDPQPGAPRP
jgi:hypothetical protein